MNYQQDGTWVADGEWCGRPTVSIIMGVYNCETTLNEAIDSIRGQTLRSWELVVCDDGSTDTTAQILEERKVELGDRLILLANDHNERLSHSLNRCLQSASGCYIARMDGDDRSHPERLQRQLDYMKAHPEVDLVGTWMRRFSGATLGSTVRVQPNPSRRTLERGSPFCHATILARRETYDRIGPYCLQPRSIRNEDLDLWFRFFSEDLVGHNIQEALYYVRENRAAIRRRTVRVRFNTLRTTFHGYRLLGLPWFRYLRPTFRMAKALVPGSAIHLHQRLSGPRQL